MFVVFVITSPETKNQAVDKLLSTKPTDYVALHPYYAFESDEGKEALVGMGCDIKDLPLDDNKWKNLMIRDIWSISKCDIVVYDNDSEHQQFHYLPLAVHFNKPVICVSESLRSIPPYFSGAVDKIIKPCDLNGSISLLIERKRNEGIF